MLHMLEKVPNGFRILSNWEGEFFSEDGFSIRLRELPMQLKRILDELWSHDLYYPADVHYEYGIDCLLVSYEGCYGLALMGDYYEDDASCLGVSYRTFKYAAHGLSLALDAELPNLDVVFGSDIKGKGKSEIWIVMPWDVDAEVFRRAIEVYGSLFCLAN